MIYITGDTHCRYDFSKLKEFAKNNCGLTKNDFMIIAGDFGGVWWKPDLEDDLNLYSDLPFSILFVDGNHENFDLLNSYPVTMWHGGKVHMVRLDIIHLMRGQVFEIEGKTFFTFGGATSVDRAMRIEGKTKPGECLISLQPRRVSTMARMARFVRSGATEKRLLREKRQSRHVISAARHSRSTVACRFSDRLYMARRGPVSLNFLLSLVFSSHHSIYDILTGMNNSCTNHQSFNL